MQHCTLEDMNKSNTSSVHFQMFLHRINSQLQTDKAIKRKEIARDHIQSIETVDEDTLFRKSDDQRFF